MHICGVLLQFLLRYKYLKLCVQILASVQNWLGHTSHFHMELSYPHFTTVQNEPASFSAVVCVAMSLQLSWCCKCLGTQLALIGPVRIVYKSVVLQISHAYSRQCIHEAFAPCAEECVSVDVQLVGTFCHSLYTDVNIHPYVQEHES